ncbi:hypothetical protein AVEN_220760-1 [Araneus ventricosus]|uniref:Uncharacterized protein n=1 Tax=Araneus ventricosus TaxID=182803 RepID=A0A4Y2M5F2_ARAVE|nr:hypothetical protein AVEN_220760-1 [Araneus ventricosus]
MIGSSVDYVRSGGMRNVPVMKAVEHLYATTATLGLASCVLLPATSDKSTQKIVELRIVHMTTFDDAEVCGGHRGCFREKSGKEFVIYVGTWKQLEYSFSNKYVKTRDLIYLQRRKRRKLEFKKSDFGIH